jgi:hypothetical protein
MDDTKDKNIGFGELVNNSIFFCDNLPESTTNLTAGGLVFAAIGGKRQGHEVPQSLLVKPGAKHPVWKTQFKSTDL